jgi:hypothetical protein
MNEVITVSKKRLRQIAALIALTLIAAVIMAGCAPGSTWNFWSDLASTVAPKAELSVVPALYCPGEILHVTWDARPQFSDCDRGAHCKSAKLQSNTDPPVNTWDLDNPWITTTLYGSGDPVGPESPPYPAYVLSVNIPRLFSPRNFFRYQWGSPDLLGGGRGEGSTIFAHARAYPYGSPGLPEGATNRNIVEVERRMVCDEDSGQWEYLPGTQTRYTRSICTPEGECTTDVTYILPGEFSIPFSACSSIQEVCGGEEGPVSFDAVGFTGGHAAFTLNSRSSCSSALAGYHPSALNGGGPLPITVDSPERGAMLGQPCTGNGLPLRRVMYSVELSPCTTPDQLIGPFATACENALTTSATEAIQSEAGPPTGDGGLVAICDLENSCGDGACQAGCEDAVSCAQDCEPSDANCPSGTYYAPVTNQCIAIQIVEPKKDNGGGDDGGGGACPAGQSWTCNLTNGKCSCK